MDKGINKIKIGNGSRKLEDIKDFFKTLKG